MENNSKAKLEDISMEPSISRARTNELLGENINAYIQVMSKSYIQLSGTRPWSSDPRDLFLLESGGKLEPASVFASPVPWGKGKLGIKRLRNRNSLLLVPVAEHIS